MHTGRSAANPPSKPSPHQLLFNSSCVVLRKYLLRSTMASFSPPSPASPNYLTPSGTNNRRATAVTPLPSTQSSTSTVGSNIPIENTDGSENGNLSLFETIAQGFENFPKVVWNIHPHVKLKLRKRIYPLGLTQLTVGADYDLRTHETSLKWSWKDRLIGARLHINGDELALTKSVDIDIQTKMDFRVAMDLRTRRTLLSMRVSPFGRVTANTSHPGLTIRQKVPLDNKLDVQFTARVTLPEARFVASSSAPISLGDGNFIVDLDELNFRFLLQ